MDPATVDQVVASGVKFDFSITVTAILAVCAIVSPILVAIINNRHQLKMRKLEIGHEEAVKRNEYVFNHVSLAFAEYLSALEKCRKHITNENKEEYGKAFGKALMYATPSTHSAMKDIDESIRVGFHNDLETIISPDKVIEISMLLRHDLDHYKNKSQIN